MATPTASVRRFTRFYTRKLGVLDQRLLGSPFSLTEARVLYELAHHRGLTAKSLGQSLGLDAGYLSRILAGFSRRGFVTKRRSTTDAREHHLELTKRGHHAFAPLEQQSNREVGEMLGALSESAQRRLIDAMRTIESLLAPEQTHPTPKKPAFSLRDPRPGDIGWIIHRQEMLYWTEYGWNQEFEALIAGIMSKFILNFDASMEKCWVAERNGEIVGSVFLVRKSKTTAQLRLLYVEPAARGLGIGARLVDECIRFARAKRYKKMTLWTNSVLGSARRIYEAAGFSLTKEEKHRSFGKILLGQNWELTL